MCRRKFFHPKGENVGSKTTRDTASFSPSSFFEFLIIGGATLLLEPLLEFSFPDSCAFVAKSVSRGRRDDEFGKFGSIWEILAGDTREIVWFVEVYFVNDSFNRTEGICNVL